MKTYTVSLELEIDAETPKEAAKEFFETVHTDHSYMALVRDAEGNFIESYDESEAQDELA